MSTIQARIPLWDGNDTAKVEGIRLSDSIASMLGLVGGGGNDDNTKLLLHMDGVDGGTVFTESAKDITRSWSASGSAQTVDDFKVFGPTSLTTAAAGAIVAAMDSDINFQSSNLTIDGRFRFTAIPAGSHSLMGAGNGAGANSKWIIWYDNSANQLVFHFYNAGNNNINFSWTPVIDTFYHIEIVRSGSSWYLFIDGVQTGGTQTNANALASITGQIKIGRDAFNELAGFSGHIDELRFSNIARHTSNFTPPISAYSQYPSDSPSPVSEWVAWPIGTVIDWSETRIFENTISTDDGSIGYKVAINGGADSGTLTQAQVKLLGETTITDAVQSVKVTPVLISDGDQYPTVSVDLITDIIILEGAGGTRSMMARSLGVKEAFKP